MDTTQKQIMPNPGSPPTPAVEQHHSHIATNEPLQQPAAVAEQALPQTEVQPMPAQPTGTAPPLQPATVVQPPAGQPAAEQVSAQTLHTDPTTARAKLIDALPVEDGDLIEKEWVETTEQAIDKTKDDPHTEDEIQNQMSKVYLKKRFNIDVS